MRCMIEVYVNNYINLSIASSKCDLDHISNATMHGKQSVFSTNKGDSENPILEKKMIKKMDSGGLKRMSSAGCLKERIK